MITAAKPIGAINKITKVTPPLTTETKALRTVADRREIYLVTNLTLFSMFVLTTIA